jgi:Ser-tRNA(Ala) deacylase AlaX
MMEVSSSGILGNVFLQNSYLFVLHTMIEHVEEIAPPGKHGSHVIQCRDTIFHPQGGGQPSDQGVIENSNGDVVFRVQFAQRNSDGRTAMLGCFEISPDSLRVGDEVCLKINAEDRIRNIRMHSAGHALDAAMERLQLSKRLIPSKGYHFADGPYVEYIVQEGCTITEEELKSLPSKLTEMISVIIHECIPSKTTIEFPAPDELEGAIYKYNRVVEVAGCSCPCGGTHVNNTSELVGVIVTKAKKKKDIVKISYEIS